MADPRSRLLRRVGLVPLFLARFGAARGVEACLDSLGCEIDIAFQSVARSATGARVIMGVLQAELRERASTLLTLPAFPQPSALFFELERLALNLKRYRPPVDTTPVGVPRALRCALDQSVATGVLRLLQDPAATALPSSFQRSLTDLHSSINTAIGVTFGALRESSRTLETRKSGGLEDILERLETVRTKMHAVHDAVRDALLKSDAAVAAAEPALIVLLNEVDELMNPLPHVYVDCPVMIIEIDASEPLQTACSVAFISSDLHTAVASTAAAVPSNLPPLAPDINDAITWFVERGVFAGDPELRAIEFGRLRSPESVPTSLVPLYEKHRKAALRLIALVRGGERVAASPPRSDKFDLSMFPGFELHGPFRGRSDAIVQRFQASTNCKEHGVLLMEQYLSFLFEIRTDPHALLAPRMLDQAALWLAAPSDAIAAHVLKRGQVLSSDELLRTVLVKNSIVAASSVKLFAENLERYGPGLISHFLVFSDVDNKSVKEHFGLPQGSCKDELNMKRL